MDVAELGTTRVLDAVGATLAQVEPDCSGSWPACPRRGVLCDCRLRAVRAVNAAAAALAQEGGGE